MIRNKKLIIACDVNTIHEFNFLVAQSYKSPILGGYKLGFSLALRYGLPKLVQLIQGYEENIPVIYDHQKAGSDIPQVSSQFAQICSEANIHSIIVFPHAGPKTLIAMVDAIVNFEMEPIIGLCMSHEAYLSSEGGYICDEAPLNMLELALQKGVSKFVLPSTKPEIAQKYAEIIYDKGGINTIMSPGIGSQGGDFTEIFNAVAPHHFCGIIGSVIYNSKNIVDTILEYEEIILGGN